jgi:hypothetical protein
MPMNPRLLRPLARGRYNALRVGLVAYWPLNEDASSGDVTAEDWTGRGNNLTSNNSVLSVAGRQGNARSFVLANSEYLAAAGNNADLRFMDGRNWTFAGWLYVPSAWVTGSDRQYFAARDPVTSGNREIAFDLRQGAGLHRVACTIGPGASPTTNVLFGDNAVAGDNLPLNSWIFFAFTYNATTRVLFGRIGSGVSANSTATGTLPAGTPVVGTSTFNLGRRQDGSYFNGYLDEVAKWDRVLSSAELDTLYNAGNGIDLRT